LTSTDAFRRGIYKTGWVRRMARWLDAMPYPSLAIEISPNLLAAVRWSHTGSIACFAVEPLPPGALVPSAVETNLVNSTALHTAIADACSRLNAKDEDVALLLPDPVIRVFVQHFGEFPRSPQEGLPMLRWKLKKRVPFEVNETVLSYMRQAPRGDGVDVVTAVARLGIVREYEALAESVGLRAGVILSSSLAAMALLRERRPTLLVRVSDTTLTTAALREDMLCIYRCTELPVRGYDLTPQMLLEEIFPVVAYYQDTWHDGIQCASVAGLAARLPEFVGPLETELHCTVQSLLHSAVSDGRISEDARPLADRELEGLSGWMLNRG
jgi:type IV pilus assembly protein PilM